MTDEMTAKLQTVAKQEPDCLGMGVAGGGRGGGSWGGVAMGVGNSCRTLLKPSSAVLSISAKYVERVIHEPSTPCKGVRGTLKGHWAGWVLQSEEEAEVITVADEKKSDSA